MRSSRDAPTSYMPETANDIKDLLATKYAQHGISRQYVLLTEVRNATGYSFSNTADALVMCMYPSQGLELQGFEIKVARSDWLHELKQPGKSQPVFQYCDRWWLVACEGVITDYAELPKGWGLMIAKNGKLFTKVKAPLLEPIEVDRTFLASLLRTATEGMVPEATLKAKHQGEYKAGVKSQEKNVADMQDKLDSFKLQVKAFEQASGIEILDGWGDIDKLTAKGKLFKFINDGGLRSVTWDTKYGVERAEEVLKEMKALDEFAKSLNALYEPN